MRLLDTWNTINGLGRLDLIFVVPLSLLVIFIPWHCCFQHSKARTTSSPPNPQVLQTLSTFVTPTSCASISDHTYLIKNTEGLKSYLIELDLSNLIDAICTGKAELRDSSDLHDLFRAKLRIYGWHFCILVDMNWSFRVSRWMVAHHAYIFLSVRLNLSQKQFFLKFSESLQLCLSVSLIL